MTVYSIRKQLGDAHEDRVAAEFRRREYRAEPFGMGTYGPTMQALTRSSASPRRFEPDLVIWPENARFRVQLIDCKAQFATDEPRPYLAVNAECVSAQLALQAVYRWPVWYVFSDLSVSTPSEVLAFGRLTPPNDPADGFYYQVPRLMCRSMDEVFGTVPATQMELPAAA